MAMNNDTFTVFAGTERQAGGDMPTVAKAAKQLIDKGAPCQVLIFNDRTGEQVDPDFRPAEILPPVVETEPEHPPKKRSPGRPKLGVVGREITLLPRHWEWLNTQPGGASVALRKLVEKARRENEVLDRRRRAQESAYRFMSAVVGDAPGFEDAIRSLFAADASGFLSCIAAWPKDVQAYVGILSEEAFKTGK
jgi:uncharacterized protein